MAILRAAGITFSDSSQLNSKFGIIPRNTAMLFFQASAPVGWIKTTTHNDKAFRVVSGVGSAFAGNISFTNTFPNSVIPITGTISIGGTAGPHTLSVDEIPSHGHTAGTSNGAFQAGPATPSRYSERTPASYGFRTSYRQPVANRQPTTYRQSNTYRQPISFRQPNTIQVRQANRVIANNRQPNQIRVPQANRTIRNYRQPFSYRQPNTVRAIRNYRQPIANRVSIRANARVNLNARTPIQVPFRNPQGGNPRRQPNPNERRFETRVQQRYLQRINTRIQLRQSTPAGRVNGGRQANRIADRGARRVIASRLAQPFNNRVPFLNGSVRLPNIRNYRQPAPVRQPNRVIQRNIANYRSPRAVRFTQSNRNPISGRTPIAIRYIRNVRFTQDNRVPIANRIVQRNIVPQSSRVLINQRNIVPQRVQVNQRNVVNSRIAVRYPAVSNVRYVSRILVPGGQIRKDDNLAPNTSFTGQDQAHSHPFTGNDAPYSLNLDLRVQYIDVIICTFDG
jgi:hypothetical protein